MGEPVRIIDVARRLIEESGLDIDVVYTGLRQGEKLDEVLFSSAERGAPSQHPLITRVEVPPLSPTEVLSNPDGSELIGAQLLAHSGSSAPQSPVSSDVAEADAASLGLEVL
jgi:FlaA1/EpsC-like NDP-sugar epimerase